MRTYRLHFSPDRKVLQRRFEKAKASCAERVLCVGFESPREHFEIFKGVWALETKDFRKELDLKSWSEIHQVVTDPPFDIREAPSNLYWILQPNRLTSRKECILWLSQFSPMDLEQKVFLEFEPWSADRPHLWTVKEISQFLYQLKFHFPEWRPRRRPGVEIWDPRIPDYFELEASEWRERKWNWQDGNPQISVVIPTFNSKHFVWKVLEHLGRQSFPKSDFEVILVDDGGGDQTLEYLNLFGVPEGLQLRYLHWPRPHLRNRGDSFFRAGLARNLGVRQARSEILVFLDSDILVPDHFLERVASSLRTADVLQFPRWHISQEKSHSGTRYQEILPEDCYIEEEKYWGPFFDSASWMSLPNFWKYTCTYALALRKKDFLEAGRFKRTYVSYGFEDTELGYHLARKGQKFHLASEKVLHLTSYTQSEYQMSQARRLRLLKRTARQFFLSTLDIEIYHHFFSLMTGEYSFWPRLRTGLYWKDKNKYLGEFDSSGSSIAAAIGEDLSMKNHSGKTSYTDFDRKKAGGNFGESKSFD